MILTVLYRRVLLGRGEGVACTASREEGLYSVQEEGKGDYIPAPTIRRLAKFPTDSREVCSSLYSFIYI
jgi:hypothetical protein